MLPLHLAAESSVDAAPLAAVLRAWPDAVKERSGDARDALALHLAAAHQGSVAVVDVSTCMRIRGGIPA